VKRRSVLAGIAGSMVWASAASAQSSDGPPVVGFLDSTALDDPYARAKIAAFQDGLAGAGFADGRNVAIEFASAGGSYDRLPALAEQFVKRPVAVILAAALPALLAAKSATSTIPIVFVMGADPVALKLVDSLSRPGHNITGVSQYFGALGGKRLEILRELVPGGATMGILSDPRNANAAMHLDELERAARTLGQKIEVFTAETKVDLPAAFSRMAERHIAALVVADDPLFTQERVDLTTLAERHRLPTIYYARQFTDAGGLIAYGSDGAANFRQAGGYVGKILKGARPADLPILQPTQFELTINVKAAKTLGLAIPAGLLARADQVIE
jgi:ABC-type uncharacterized transport system substrate-binding protein